MRKIDFEAHYYCDLMMDTLSKLKGYPRYEPDTNKIWYNDDFKIMAEGPMMLEREGMLETRIQDMDDCGIDLEVLSHCPGFEQIDRKTAVEIAPRLNDTTKEVMEKYPGRFLGYAELPVQDIDAACKELERCVKELGFFGWNTHSCYGPNGFVDEDKYRPIIECCAELGVPMYVHPDAAGTERFAGYGQFLAAVGSFTLTTQLSLIRLILSGIFDKYPDFKVMSGHMGEGIPFYLERLDKSAERAVEETATIKYAPSYYFKNNIIMTTSGQYSKAAFECAKTVVGIDNFLFGTDYPMERKLYEATDFIDSLSLSQEERDKIYYKNAERLFGKDLTSCK